MSKRKRKLTSAEKRARKEPREKFMTIFLNGKQKRVRRPQTIDGMSVDEFLMRNADPAWLHQNEMWHLIPDQSTSSSSRNAGEASKGSEEELGDIPF